jgi:hypothetical protein
MNPHQRQQIQQQQNSETLFESILAVRVASGQFFCPQPDEGNAHRSHPGMKKDLVKQSILWLNKQISQGSGAAFQRQAAGGTNQLMDVKSALGSRCTW